MAISLRQLEYFVTVVDEGSFTRAAELLQVSQPGLSHQIQALERELGGPLLERLPRKGRLTPAGRHGRSAPRSPRQRRGPAGTGCRDRRAARGHPVLDQHRNPARRTAYLAARL